MRMYVCICRYSYVYIYIHMSTLIQEHVYNCVFANKCFWTYVYLYIYIYMYVCIVVCKNMNVYVCGIMCLQACMYTCIGANYAWYIYKEVYRCISCKYNIYIYTCEYKYAKTIGFGVSDNSIAGLIAGLAWMLRFNANILDGSKAWGQGLAGDLLGAIQAGGRGWTGDAHGLGMLPSRRRRWQFRLVAARVVGMACALYSRSLGVHGNGLGICSNNGGHGHDEGRGRKSVGEFSLDNTRHCTIHVRGLKLNAIIEAMIMYNAIGH